MTQSLATFRGRELLGVSLIILAMLGGGCASPNGPGPARLARSLTFHASFDQGIDADFARGDGKLYTAPGFNRQSNAVAGLPATSEVVVADNAGRFGNALRFTRKQSPLVYFKAADNLPYSTSNWNGTVSFWLSLDPEVDLEPGFTDPIQITPKAWNNAAFFVEFGKDEKPRHFRLGVYADPDVWNPRQRKFEELTMAEKPLISVERPPFRRSKWTHVAFTFENFNTGRPDGVATLYLDGVGQGSLSPRVQTFTWKPDATLVMLGLSYIGLFDELSIFDRALSPAEITELYQLKNGVGVIIASGGGTVKPQDGR